MAPWLWRVFSLCYNCHRCPGLLYVLSLNAATKRMKYGLFY